MLIYFRIIAVIIIIDVYVYMLYSIHSIIFQIFFTFYCCCTDVAVIHRYLHVNIRAATNNSYLIVD